MRFSILLISTLLFLSFAACKNETAIIKAQIEETKEAALQKNSELEEKVASADLALQNMYRSIKTEEVNLNAANQSAISPAEFQKQLSDIQALIEGKKMEVSKVKATIDLIQPSLESGEMEPNAALASSDNALSIAKQSIEELKKIELALEEATILFEEMTGKRPLENLK